MSETGIYGLSLMLFLLFRCWVFSPRAFERENWVMSNGLVIIIVIYLVRQGHYFYNGFPFFLWMYYYNFEINASNRKRVAAELEEQKKTTANPFALTAA
jgi:hypothetical protein